MDMIATPPAHHTDPATIAVLETIETRLRWLSSWTIHNANHLRESRDGLKVGGHQASCASITAIMTALYFGALRPNDKVAVKPHAGPVLHAIHYMLGQQSQDALERYRGMGGAQSYPSRTKDTIPVISRPGRSGSAWRSPPSPR
ncbi:pyruvate dehydrogenase complex dehydrogenase (E1) component [Sphingomonas sp. UYP23]